ncbi:MAG: transposase [Desulfotignum sp.]|nr:transposase [Desulfotignum sp.]
MPRAHRYFLPGLVWHITHRCHKKEFLLKFAKDRYTWVHWLFESRRRYGIEILNYAVTSNHIHLLVYGNENRETIPRTLQLAAGRTAQAFNKRKNRKGAFWEDRYHATAVDTDGHFLRCMLYIDLNMVRAGTVKHPAEWPHCGYHEIISPPQRYRILARKRLGDLLHADPAVIAPKYHQYVDAAIDQFRKMPMDRAEIWSGAIAVGRPQFVEQIKDRLGVAARSRRIEPGHQEAECVLREEAAPYYTNDFKGKMDGLSFENKVFWKVFPEF